jgi:ABC-type antimicrobial peptide transport system permease subunit
MEGVRAETLTQERVAAQTVSLFALLGLSLAAIGTYGVISYTMARRTRELAIRAALGAAPRALIQLVMGRGFMLAGIGIAVGVGAALALHRVVASQLTQVAASDPRIHGGVSLVLLGVAALASWLPARRAVKVDPAIALRAE